MGYRGVLTKEHFDDSTFRVMEVVMVKKTSAGEKTSSQVLMIENEEETLRHVHENWNDFIGNLIRVKKMIERDMQKVTDHSEIFGRSLQPLFTRMSESAGKNLLANLSKSLKKALILLALERYEGDLDVICKILGIDRERLDTEMCLCGLKQSSKAA